MKNFFFVTFVCFSNVLSMEKVKVNDASNFPKIPTGVVGSARKLSNAWRCITPAEIKSEDTTVTHAKVGGRVKADSWKNLSNLTNLQCLSLRDVMQYCSATFTRYEWWDKLLLGITNLPIKELDLTGQRVPAEFLSRIPSTITKLNLSATGVTESDLESLKTRSLTIIITSPKIRAESFVGTSLVLERGRSRR